MKRKDAKKWNREVSGNVAALKRVRNWLGKEITGQDSDWETKKSAHQAFKFLELAEYEMLNMQWWKDSKERQLYLKAENTVA